MSQKNRLPHALLLGLGATVVAAAASVVPQAAAAATTANAPGAASPAGASSAGASTQHVQALVRDANSYWMQEMRALRSSSYDSPQLTLFEGTIKGVCMAAQPLAGPFYCPSDEHIYLDESFLRRVAQRAGPAADVALAYIVGHEFGKHVQALVGTTALVEQARASSTATVSARTWATAELQSDCYAGLWVRWGLMQGQVRAADTATALEAVAAVSRTLQAHLPKGAAMVDPIQSYGTPTQRLKWFQRGESSGNFNDCDTFGAEAAGTL